MIQKLGAREIIKESEVALLDKQNPDIYRNIKSDTKKFVLDISLQY